MMQARPDEPAAQATLCPYCGHVSGNPKRCRVCGGLFDPLSRQATQNTMGPWFVRDESSPHLPGCSYETLRKLVLRGKVGRASIIRGPTTRQFWVIATRVPGVAHLLGECHSCHAPTSAQATSCPSCGARFVVSPDRQQMGLGPVHLLPGQASPEQIAAQSGSATPVSGQDPSDVAQAARAEPPPLAMADEAPETPEQDDVPGGVPVGRITLGLLIVAGCAGLAAAGWWRGVFTMSSARPEPVMVESAPEADASVEEADVASADVAEAAQAPAANPSVLELLKAGRIEAARLAIERAGAKAGPAHEAIEERAARDRIRAFLPG